MVIVHIQLPSPYIDGWGYQENGLVYVESKQGHNVYVLAPNYVLEPNNEVRFVDEGFHTSVEGGRIYRIKQKKSLLFPFLDKFLNRYPLYDLLVEIHPDLVMVHGLAQGLYIKDVLKYKKHNLSCTLVADSHRTPENTSSKKIKSVISRLYFTLINKKFLKVCDRVFGLTPQCVQHTIKTRGVPENLIELLPLGYNPYIVNWENRKHIRNSFREKMNINETDIVIVHGGKIIPRRKTEEVICAFNELCDKNSKLIIFGDICDDMRNKITPLVENSNNVIYLGHLSQQNYIDVFLSSDIACFPGGQSVLWEEAIGCGLPLILNKEENVDYLNENGNVQFCRTSSSLDVLNALKQIMKPGVLNRMKLAAENRRDFFSYERISNRILEVHISKNENQSN